MDEADLDCFFERSLSNLIFYVQVTFDHGCLILYYSANGPAHFEVIDDLCQ